MTIDGKDQHNALIGFTGFVGRALLRQAEFAGQFNSRNSGELGDSDFDLAVCAAAPGSMFEANRFPEQDEAAVKSLIQNLEKLRCGRFVLISTIAVYEQFDGKDDETSTSFQTQTPYGKNRRLLESFCEDHFDQCTIVRLPALFGADLKKNFLFDMMNPVPSMLTADKLTLAQESLPPPLADLMGAFYTLDEGLGLYCVDRDMVAQSEKRGDLEQALIGADMSALGFTNPESCFQFYSMAQIWDDCLRAIENGLSAVNLATEPMRAGDVFQAFFGDAMPANGARVHQEDMRTQHAALWGHEGGYIASAQEVLPAIVQFMKHETGQE